MFSPYTQVRGWVTSIVVRLSNKGIRNMGKIIKIRDVFKSRGQPTTTYVEREEGLYENKLALALEAKGTLCLLTGPSKTGKTTLYKKVVTDQKLEALVVRCDIGLTATEFWKSALEKIDFERLNTRQSSEGSQVSGSGKVGGKIGWAWLAGLLGEVSLGVNSSTNETEIRERILSKPSPDHLIPVLQRLPIILIVEDFHYLQPNVKKNIFQQWKAFVDNEVSVIVVGTTHHAVDLAYANPDLVGRISQIDLSTWNEDDLKKIVIQGTEYLKVQVPNSVVDAIAKESAGLPIVTQDVCYQLFVDKGITELKQGEIEVIFSVKDAYKALHGVAVTNYAQFETIYERLVTGPRKRARKYNTYELVLSTFTQDPLTFSLKRHEIDERLKEIPLPSEQLPPPASVSSMLGALEKFQKRNGIELLEWSKKEQRLHILEPSFLFYLRWREKRDTPPTIRDILEGFLKSVKTLSDLHDRLVAK